MNNVEVNFNANSELPDVLTSKNRVPSQFRNRSTKKYIFSEILFSKISCFFKKKSFFQLYYIHYVLGWHMLLCTEQMVIGLQDFRDVANMIFELLPYMIIENDNKFNHPRRYMESDNTFEICVLEQTT